MSFSVTGLRIIYCIKFLLGHFSFTEVWIFFREKKLSEGLREQSDTTYANKNFKLVSRTGTCGGSKVWLRNWWEKIWKIKNWYSPILYLWQPKLSDWITFHNYHCNICPGKTSIYERNKLLISKNRETQTNLETITKS